jgi:hypothetical protein
MTLSSEVKASSNPDKEALREIKLRAGSTCFNAASAVLFNLDECGGAAFEVLAGFILGV